MSKGSVILIPIWDEDTVRATMAAPIPSEQRDEFLRRIRDARLQEVEQIEKMLGINPTTAEIRRRYKEAKRAQR